MFLFYIKTISPQFLKEMGLKATLNINYLLTKTTFQILEQVKRQSRVKHYQMSSGSLGLS